MKKETLKEAAENYAKQFDYAEDSDAYSDFIKGAKWQKKRMYSDKDIINALHSVELKDNKDYTKIYNGMKEWFEQSKKRL
jgi:secreted Zn-dependent insulinase-like peptidase